jgi:hypothetical protein
MQDGNAPPTGTAVPNTGESTLCAHPLTSTRGALYLIDEQTPERARAQGHSQRAMIAPHAMIVTGHTIAAGHAAITHVTVREMWPLSHPNPTAQAPASVAMRHLPAPRPPARTQQHATVPHPSSSHNKPSAGSRIGAACTGTRNCSAKTRAGFGTEFGVPIGVHWSVVGRTGTHCHEAWQRKQPLPAHGEGQPPLLPSRARDPACLGEGAEAVAQHAQPIERAAAARTHARTHACTHALSCGGPLGIEIARNSDPKCSSSSSSS